MSASNPLPVERTSTVRRVLVCESDRDLREQLSQILLQAGWNVEEYVDATTLLEEATRPGATIDAVVIALDMPGAGGLDFVDYLHSVRPMLPIVLLATRGEAPTYDEARRAGASLTLDHALDFDALSAFLAHVVGRRRALEAMPASGKSQVVTVPWAPSLPSRADLPPGSRRREDRYELDRPRPSLLRVAGEEHARDATIRNVTSRGCGLVHRGSPLALDQKVVVECRVPRPVDRSFRIAGRVAWTRSAGPGNEIGVEFDRPDSSEARRVVYDLLVAD